MHWKGTQYILVKEMCSPRGIVLPNPPSIPVPLPHPIGSDPQTVFLLILPCQWFPFLWSVWSSVLNPSRLFLSLTDSGSWEDPSSNQHLSRLALIFVDPPHCYQQKIQSDPWCCAQYYGKLTQQRYLGPNIKSWYLGMQPYLEIESLWM